MDEQQFFLEVLLFYFTSQVASLFYTSRSSSSTLAISLMASSTFTCQAATSRIAPCCHSSAVAAVPIRPSTRSRTSRSRRCHLGKGVVGWGIGGEIGGGRVGGSGRRGGASAVISAAFRFNRVGVLKTGTTRLTTDHR